MYLYLKEDKNIIWKISEWIIVPGKSDSIIVREKNLKKMLQNKKSWLAKQTYLEASFTKRKINVRLNKEKL